MKKHLFSVLAIASALLCGCTKADIDSSFAPDSSQEPIFTATTVSDAQTRTSLGDSYQVLWSAKDTISIFKGTTDNRKYGLSSGASTTSATFKYAGWVNNGSTTLNPSSNYALYPYDKDATISADLKISTEIKAEQNYTAGSFENGAAVMVAKSTTTALSFKNAVGLIRFKFMKESTPDDFKVLSVKVTSAAQKISGDVVINMSGDTFQAVVSGNNTGNSITLDCGDGVSASATEAGVTNLYMVVPAATFVQNDLTFEAKLKIGTQDSTFKFKNANTDITVGRSKIVTIKHTFTEAEFTGETEPYALEAEVETVSAANTALVNMTESGNKSVTVTSPVATAASVSVPKSFTKVNTPQTAFNLASLQNQLTVNDEDNTSNEYDGNVSIDIEKTTSDASLVINLPESTVSLNSDESLSSVTSSTAENTLIISAGTSISSLHLNQGNVENYGTVATVTAGEGTFIFYAMNGQSSEPSSHPINVTVKYPDAKIGDVKYATLQKAFNAVKSGETITLLQNVTIDSTLVVGDGKNFTMDLGAYNIIPNAAGLTKVSGSETKDCLIAVCRGGKITINGTTGKISSNNIESVYSAVKMTVKGETETGNKAEFVLNGGTLEGYYYAIVGNGGRHNTAITINGGTITAQNSGDNQGIFNPQEGTVTVNGGTINAVSSAIEMRAGTLTINDGTFKATATSFECKANGSGTTTIGAAIAVAEHNTMKGVTVIINGGTFTGYKSISNENPQNNDPWTYDITINGGTFSDLAGIVYAGDNATIKLGQNVAAASGISVPSGKNFTVDFGGHTYLTEKPGAGSTGTTTQAFQLLKNSTITFKNGTIGCTAANKDCTWASTDTDKGVALIIQNYSNLTLENMTIDAANIAHNGSNIRYAVSNNSGTVNFTGSTSIKALAGDVAFDVCKYQTYDKPNVFWSSTGTVEGAIELAGGNFTVNKALVVNAPIVSTSGTDSMCINAKISPASTFNSFANSGDAIVLVKRKGALIIDSENGDGSIESGSVLCAVKMTAKGESTESSAEYAYLTVKGGKIIGNGYGITGNGTRPNTYVTISGGTVKATASDGIGVYNPQDGSLLINGGTIEGSTGVAIKSGVAVVATGGTVKGTGAKAEYSYNGDGFTSTGDAFAVDNCSYPGGHPTVTIDGATLVSTNGCQVGAYFGGEENTISPVYSSVRTYTVPQGYKWSDEKTTDDDYTDYYKLIKTTAE